MYNCFNVGKILFVSFKIICYGNLIGIRKEYFEKISLLPSWDIEMKQVATLFYYYWKGNQNRELRIHIISGRTVYCIDLDLEVSQVIIIFF